LFDTPCDTKADKSSKLLMELKFHSAERSQENKILLFKHLRHPPVIIRIGTRCNNLFLFPYSVKNYHGELRQWVVETSLGNQNIIRSIEHRVSHRHPVPAALKTDQNLRYSLQKWRMFSDRTKTKAPKGLYVCLIYRKSRSNAEKIFRFCLTH
jgi:hypothetical protein